MIAFLGEPDYEAAYGLGAKELLDVAACALYAHYHVKGGDTMGALQGHIRDQAARREATGGTP